MEELAWFLAVVGVPLLLGIVIAFSLLRRRHPTSGEGRARHREIEHEHGGGLKRRPKA
jgi:hypothetical protein